jgi:hypothetical protein
MDLTRLGGTEKALSGAGVLVFILSFLPWFEVSEFGLSFHADAWSFPSGFNDWFPVLLLFAYAIVLALPAFGVVVRIPALESGANRALVGLVLSAFAVLMFAIQGLTYPGSGFGYTAGPAWAYFISLLIVLAAAVLSWLGFVQQGGSFARIGGAFQGLGQSSGARPRQQFPTQPTAGQRPYPPYNQPYPPPYQGYQGQQQPPYPPPQQNPQSPYPGSPPQDPPQ